MYIYCISFNEKLDTCSFLVSVMCSLDLRGWRHFVCVCDSCKLLERLLLSLLPLVQMAQRETCTLVCCRPVSTGGRHSEWSRGLPHAHHLLTVVVKRSFPVVSVARARAHSGELSSQILQWTSSQIITSKIPALAISPTGSWSYFWFCECWHRYGHSDLKLNIFNDVGVAAAELERRRERKRKVSPQIGKE